MKIKILICLGALLGVAAVNVVKNQFELPKAKLTVRVLDEQGALVQGAFVNLTFTDTATRQGVPVEGLTNTNGLFSGEGTSESSLGGYVQKKSYYRAGFPFEPFREVDKLLNHWLPWNATYTSILRPIVNPVALYAKRVRAELPELDRPCGYDLEKGDWVAPYGKGIKSDFIFTGHRDFKTRQNFDVNVELKFSNPNDGLLKVELPEVGKHSTFKWQRMAPDSGYTSVANLSESAHGDNFAQAYERTDTFFFRVRTVATDERIGAANYGKISGGLRLDARNSKKSCIILFTYYLNPKTLDRNLEWDTTKNLIPGLKSEETPQDP